MEKIDYKKELKHLYRPSAKKVEAVDVPKMNFFMIDGEGDSNTSHSFQDAIDALYPLSYALKFMSKRDVDYGVLPLEVLWWADDMSSFSVESKKNWKWALMIMQPELITKKMVKEAENMETATELAMNDPFVVREAIETKWVKEWIRE